MNEPDFTTPSPLPLPALRGPHRAAYVGLLLVGLLAFFWRLGSAPLFDLDEALYVTCAREMVLSGDIVTPRLNSRPLDRPNETTVPFFEKPILVYWLSAASLRVFGMSEGAARLPAAFAALLTTGAVVWTGTHWFGRRAGLLAGLVYALAPMTLVDARQMTTDGLLVLWFTLTLLTFWRTQELPREASWPAALLFWTLCALSILTKGAVGLLLPFLVLGIFLLLKRIALRVRLRSGLNSIFLLRWNHWRDILPVVVRLRPFIGLLLCFALAAPWHYFVWKAGERDANGRTFTQEYIVRQHIGRFKGGDTVHNAPLPTYFAYFLLGFFPWACFAPAAFRYGKPAPSATLPRTSDAAENVESAAKDGEAQEWERYRFLLVWFWTIFVFFSAGAAKLPTYIAPAYPAAALLMGRWLDGVLTADSLPVTTMRSLRRGAFGGLLTASLLLAVAILAPRLAPDAATLPDSVEKVVLHLTGLLTIGCFAGWLCLQQKGTKARRTGVGILAGTMLAVAGVGCTEGYAAAARDVLAPYQEIAEAAQRDARMGLPVVFYHIIPRRPSMLYYARYSPLERKETPLLPFLRAYRDPHESALVADIITSRRTLDEQLASELTLAGTRWRVIQTRGDEKNGWVLLRVIWR